MNVNRASSLNSTDLSDGFREVFSFPGHKVLPRGMECLEVLEEKEFCTDVRDVYLSWDLLSAHVWVREHHPPAGKPMTKILHTLKFPTGCKGFISSIVYMPKLKIYLAAALDMCFKIYDKSLALVESIRHEERSLAYLKFLPGENLVAAASATGVSLWRLYRNSAANMAYTMERVFVFAEVREWMNRIEIEASLGHLYAFAGTSCYVFDFHKRRLLHRLERIHEMTVNAICWYGRSQFYLTGCGGGLIKCWTSLHYQDKHKSGPGDDMPTFSLLHTFRLHTASVTGLVLHPTSGMAVSTSLDGVVRLLNLENFTEIYNISLDGVGVVAMKLLDYAPKGKKAIMFADVNKCIRVWKITTAVGFFGVMNSNVVSVTKFENMHEELITNFYDKSDPVCRLRRMTDVNGKVAADEVFADCAGFGKRDSDTESDVEDDADVARKASGSSSRRSIRTRVGSANSGALGVGSNASGAKAKDNVELALKAVQLQMNRATLKKIAEEENKRSRAFLSPSYVGSLSTGPQDLRIFSDRGATVSVLEPEVIVDGIVCYTVSVYQHLLFCLFESGHLKTFCTRSADAPLLLTVDTRAGSQHGEVGLCISLTDHLPINAQRPAGKVNGEYLFDIRGNHIPWYISETIVIGCKSGALLFFDTLTNCEFCYILATAQQVPIVDMHYRHRKKELFTLGRGPSPTGALKSCIRVFNMPSLNCILEVGDLRSVSVFAIAPSLPYFGLGCTDGDVRIFVMQGYAAAGSSSKSSAQMEVMRQPGPGPDKAHRCTITSLAFCDEMKIFASCSADQIVMLWTYAKEYIRSLSYNMPVVCLAFNGPPGDLVFSQNNYLLTITKNIWDAGGALLAMEDLQSLDPWAVAGSTGMGMAEGLGVAGDKNPENEGRGEDEDIALVPRDHGLGPYCAPKMPPADGQEEEESTAARDSNSAAAALTHEIESIQLEEERNAHEKDSTDARRTMRLTQKRDADLFSAQALFSANFAKSSQRSTSRRLGLAQSQDPTLAEKKIGSFNPFGREIHHEQQGVGEIDTRHPRINVLPRKPAVMNRVADNLALSASKHVPLLSPRASIVLLATTAEKRAEINAERRALLAAAKSTAAPGAESTESASISRGAAIAFATIINQEYRIKRRTFHEAIGGGPGETPPEVPPEEIADKKVSLKELVQAQRLQRRVSQSLQRKSSSGARGTSNSAAPASDSDQESRSGSPESPYTTYATITETDVSLSPRPPDEIRPSSSTRTARFAV